MSWLVTAKQYIPAVIGESFGGGYFAGYISHAANGNPTHALIVAPREAGATGSTYPLTTDLAWKTTNTATTGTSSTFDGVANTAAMVTAGIANHPAANFCKNLSIGDFTDWYLPSRDELDIAYFNLKPSTALNTVDYGVNDYSVPKKTVNYSLSYPAQTYLSSFNTSSQSFLAAFHWSSTEFNATGTYYLSFANGNIGLPNKTSEFRVRAFRRITL